MSKEEGAGIAAQAEYRRELRTALARELHDGPIQSLTEAVIRLEGYRTGAASSAMQAAISDVEEDVRIALMSLRHLVNDLRDVPPAAEVTDTIRSMAARFQSATGVEVALVVSPAWPSRVPAGVAVNVIRIVQEAITNGIRHGGGEHVLVELATTAEGPTVTISDDGRGIEPQTPPGSGLIGMRERAALLGGTMHVRRRHPGTEITVQLPKP